MMTPSMGDAFINLQKKQGAGFNACSLRHVTVNGDAISFDVETFPALRTIKVRFSGVDTHAKYRITWNGSHASTVDGGTLSRDGYVVQQ